MLKSACTFQMPYYANFTPQKINIDEELGSLFYAWQI